MKATKVCDLCLILHKICCKMVWKFCEIRIFYGNCLPDGPNSVRFYLTVWDMACMHINHCLQNFPIAFLFCTKSNNLQLVISRSKGLSKILRDILPQHIRFTELWKKINQITTSYKWIIWLLKIEIYWKYWYCGKEEKLLLSNNFSSFPQ